MKLVIVKSLFLTIADLQKYFGDHGSNSVPPFHK